MKKSLKVVREKLSTTVSAETYQFLQQMVKHGEVATLAEAVDAIVGKIQHLENRRRLADATARYFKDLPAAEAAEESALAKDLSAASGEIDFDSEI